MDAKNGQVTNEKLLFHGTDAGPQWRFVNGTLLTAVTGEWQEARNLAASKEVLAMRSKLAGDSGMALCSLMVGGYVDRTQSFRLD